MATANVDTRKFLSETKFYEGYSRYKDDEGQYDDYRLANYKYITFDRIL